MKSASATGRRLKHPFLAAGLGAVALLAAAAPGGASLVPAMDLAALTENASRVVLGEVVSVRSTWDKGRRYIYTTIEVQVAEVWKGATPAGGRLKMVQPGGSVGDIEMRVFGLRSMRAGERAVLFLGPGDPSWTVGLGQGQRPVRFDAVKRRWMVDPGDRSAVWRSGTSPGWQDGDDLTALDDLRQKVRTLVGR